MKKKKSQTSKNERYVTCFQLGNVSKLLRWSLALRARFYVCFCFYGRKKHVFPKEHFIFYKMSGQTLKSILYKRRYG